MKIIFIISILLYANTGEDEKNLAGILEIFGQTNYIIHFVDNQIYNFRYPQTPYPDVSYEQFYKDSLNYHAAVRQFNQLDLSIIDTLLGYLNDSSDCNWIRQHHPEFSFYTFKEKLVKRKDIAALILIENYLKPSYNDMIYIPNFFQRTENLDLPLKLLDKEYIRKYWERYGTGDKNKIISQFIQHSGSHKYTDYYP